MQPEHDIARSSVAVVAGVDLNGLGVVRSLAKARLRTIALDTDLTKSTLRTRFARKIQIPMLSGNGFVDSLLDLARKLAEKPVLLLTQEESVATVSAAREQLEGFYHFSMPSHSTMQMLMDKSSFQRTAEALGCSIPRSIRLEGNVGIESLTSLRFPCVLKPLTKDPGYSGRFAKAYKVSSAQEAAQLWTEIRAFVREVIVQEWIEGEDSDVYFCLQYRGRSGFSPVSFVGRKICQWPPLVGGTASCVPAPEAWDQLVALTDAFFASVGFVGLGSMEYKRDPRDSKFYMVEPTVGRTDYQEEIATLNGVNIPLAAYWGELGQPPPQASLVLPPRAWRDPIGMYKSRAAGATDAIMRVAPRARVCDAYFRLNDPGPYLYLKGEPLARRLSKIWHGGSSWQ